ncbi:MAG: PfaD family polyunsaturated fatty acid/polyketide biosynthesis protein [Acidobacteriota bacterium]|nr:PfaD family polyunsaturated fatty acid/polyketide biosynthesis protein [Acidobacteriota bacterium]
MTGSYSLPRESRRVSEDNAMGWWRPDDAPGNTEILLSAIDTPLLMVSRNGALALYPESAGSWCEENGDSLPVLGRIPAVNPASLGDASFCDDHGLRYPYVSGAMANGIGSVAIAVAMARAGMLGFFGAAGLTPKAVARAIEDIRAQAGDAPFGVNLIHAPNETSWEEEMVDLLLDKKVHLAEASAYLRLTLPVVRYRVKGIHQDHLGRITAPNHIVAKVSRTEVAQQFMSPPPEKLLAQLVSQGEITAEQAELARHIPMAQDITAEADSGGHTDNRPAIALLPTLCALRDRLVDQYNYRMPIRVGLAGGIATPASAAAAFAMGAAYILLGSVHQSCRESGSSDLVRAMLAEAGQADIAMAPAADMFEMGVNLQVLKRGTMFPMRAAKLYEYYRNYPHLEAIPLADRQQLEKTVFRTTLDDVWNQTKRFFAERDPRQIQRAESDPKHKMALVFRWYLGKSSHWANSGDPGRKIDYQVWCGPAMGAFNEWVKGSFLQGPENRAVTTVAQNILYGACVLARVNFARAFSFPVSAEMTRIAPIEPHALKEFFR